LESIWKYLGFDITNGTFFGLVSSKKSLEIEARRNLKKIIAMQETVIDAHNLSKIYDEKTIPVYALNKVHLHILRGEFTAIKGPSGSGKTTLLNMLGGLDVPSEGFVEISGTNITALKGNELIDFRLNNIGFVFQSYNLIPVLTAKENIEFIMLLQNRSKEETEQRVLELLKQIGLEDKINKRPKELSGGQQQRVAVARALATKPKFILADEPTANLDSVSAENLLDMMLKLNQEENMTFIFSTHDQRVINRARRVITLEDGKIVDDTAPTAIEHLQK
jgi:putative ABC transport system ATP-binding protein